jgi:hypothetical protein
VKQNLSGVVNAESPSFGITLSSLPAMASIKKSASQRKKEINVISDIETVIDALKRSGKADAAELCTALIISSVKENCCGSRDHGHRVMR